MDLGAVVILLVVLVSGLALGTTLNLVRPRDEDSAAAFTQHRSRALAWLRARRQSRASRAGTESHRVRRQSGPALRG